MIVSNKRGGELFCCMFKIFASKFCGIILSEDQKLKLKNEKKIIKGDKDFTWKPLGLIRGKTTTPWDFKILTMF